MWKIVQAILSGKSREEVYNMLSPEQKETLNSLAIANGINRQQRRKLERDAKRDYIDELLELADNVLYMDYCRLFPGYPMERLERFERVLHWVIPLAVLVRVLAWCL